MCYFESLIIGICILEHICMFKEASALDNVVWFEFGPTKNHFNFVLIVIVIPVLQSCLIIYICVCIPRIFYIYRLLPSVRLRYWAHICVVCIFVRLASNLLISTFLNWMITQQALEISTLFISAKVLSDICNLGDSFRIKYNCDWSLLRLKNELVFYILRAFDISWIISCLTLERSTLQKI